MRWVDLSQISMLMACSSLYVVGCHWWSSWDGWLIDWHSIAGGVLGLVSSMGFAGSV